MGKTHSYPVSWSIVSAFLILTFVLTAGSIFADSTIGTNMSTTGTLTVSPATDSATSVRFQNAAGTNVFIVNSTAQWVGVGGAPQTKFEVQGTASSSYLMVANTIQVGEFSTKAYNRFGSDSTSYTSDIDSTDDLLITGALEVNNKVFFDSTASISGNFQTAGRFILGDGGDTGEFNTSNWTFRSDGSASLAVGFEVTGTSGYASASSLFGTTNLVVGHNVASSSSEYIAEFGGGSGTATVSLLFGSSSASSAGTCFQMKNTAGDWVYLRINGTASTSLEINTTSCH